MPVSEIEHVLVTHLLVETESKRREYLSNGVGKINC